MPPTPPISRHTARTLEALRADLLALEQGCEPNLDRLLRQLAALVSAEDTVEQSELADLGERLSEYLDELREEGTPVRIEIERETLTGKARLWEGDSEALRARVHRYLCALPRDAKFYAIELDENRQPVEERLAKIAPQLVFVEIELD